MVKISWNGSSFSAEIVEKAMDGIEEWCQGTWLPQATQDCPVDNGVMRSSLGVERHEDYCVVGGGGEASSYIAKQELDRSLRHRVGKAGFIQDSVTMHKSELIEIVKKKIK